MFFSICNHFIDPLEKEEILGAGTLVSFFLSFFLIKESSILFLRLRVCLFGCTRP